MGNGVEAGKKELERCSVASNPDNGLI